MVAINKQTECWALMAGCYKSSTCFWGTTESGIIWSLCLRKAARKLGYLVVKNKVFFTFTAGRQSGLMRCCKDDPGLFC